MQWHRLVCTLHHMAMIRRHGPGWQVRIKIGPYKRHPLWRTFPRKRDAQQWAGMVEAEIRAGRYTPSRGHTVSDLIDRYLKHRPTRITSDATWRKRQSQLEVWRDHLGSVPVDELRRADLIAVRDELLEERAAATVNRYLSAIGSVLSRAVREWELLPTNPAREIGRLQESPRRVEIDGETMAPYLDVDQRRRLLAACRETGHPNLHDLALLALSTGARQGELVKLTRSAVDLRRGRVEFRDTKNRTSRSVPIGGAAFEVLRDRLRVPRIDTPYLFIGPLGAVCFPKAAWEVARERAGLPDLRWHDLRHVAASEFAMAGATDAQLMHIMGWKTAAMARRYAHLRTDSSDAVVMRAVEGLV